MKYYVKLPVIPMRKYPKNEAEVVSQAYFSEEVLVFEKEQDWSHIRTVSDKYCGWVETSALHLRDSFFPNSAIIATVERCAAHVYKAEDTIYGPFLTLPFESKLEVPTMPTDPASRWIYVTLVDGSPGYIQRGDVSLQETKKTQEELIEFSKRFLGLPYTWEDVPASDMIVLGLFRCYIDRWEFPSHAMLSIKCIGRNFLKYPSLKPKQETSFSGGVMKEQFPTSECI